MELILFVIAIGVFVAGLAKHRINAASVMLNAVVSAYYSPGRVLNAAMSKLAHRRAEHSKNCDCCSKRIKLSDTLCASCKLEISLGKNVQVGKK